MNHKVNDVNIHRYNATMARSTYHHGDLRRALLAEATELARSSGPDAVTLREVARRLGVSPAAIYRHVADREGLLGEVAAMARLRLAQRMLDEVKQVDETDPQTRSIRRFQAIGRGYILFAAEEPNLLAAAFLPVEPPNPLSETPNPWNLLATALNELVATGAMPAERRAGAETIAWSAVHGFATLRASHAFDSSGEPDPDPDAVLDAVARSLDVKPSPGSGPGLEPMSFES
jgi:AcrR family transcriptional regulator